MTTNPSIEPDASVAAKRLETRSANTVSRRQLLLIGAAVTGGLAGGLFSSQIAAAVARLWSDYVVPAFFELMLSGIPLCA